MTYLTSFILLIAVILFVAAIIVGSTTKDSWKSTGIAWALLLLGIMIFGIVLTL